MKKILLFSIFIFSALSCNQTPKKENSNENSTLKEVSETPHILIVNYNLNEMTVEEHSELGTNVAPNFTPEKINGLIGKSFIGDVDNGIYGGVYQFKSKKSAEDYINSEFWLGIEAHPNLVNFKKEIFAVPAFSNQSNGFWAERKTSSNPDDANGLSVLIVRYNLENMTLDEHLELGVSVAPNFTPEKIDGLIGKSFIGDPENGVFGGVYHFKTTDAANKYISSEFWLGIEAHPNLVNFSKEIFGVAPISSVSNGIPVL